MNGAKLPKFFRDGDGRVTVSTVWNRLQNGRGGEHFDPFDSIIFLEDSGHQLPEIPASLGATGLAIVEGLRAMTARDGYQNTHKELNRRSRGNAARFLDRYAQFLPAVLAPAGNVIRFSRADLLAGFHASIQKQFAA